MRCHDRATTGTSKYICKPRYGPMMIRIIIKIYCQLICKCHSSNLPPSVTYNQTVFSSSIATCHHTGSAVMYFDPSHMVSSLGSQRTQTTAPWCSGDVIWSGSRPDGIRLVTGELTIFTIAACGECLASHHLQLSPHSFFKSNTYKVGIHRDQVVSTYNHLLYVCPDMMIDISSHTTHRT